MLNGGPGKGPRLRANSGVTLPEMLTALTVLVLLSSVMLPDFRNLRAGSDAVSTMMDLRRLIERTRSEAVLRGAEIMLCGSNDGENCTRAWHGAFAHAFIDRNANRRWDRGDERVLMGITRPFSRVYWRASGARPYLRFTPAGGVREFGTFTYCPDTRSLRHVRQITLNITGRPRDVAVASTGDPTRDLETFRKLCPDA